jgi:NADPH:quinone reductase-like Zn-dependent oxidoreductase
MKRLSEKRRRCQAVTQSEDCFSPLCLHASQNFEAAADLSAGLQLPAKSRQSQRRDASFVRRGLEDLKSCSSRSSQQKTALITGGSRGIGRAVALALAAHGASVAIGYVRNEALAREVVDSIGATGGKAIAAQADLSRPTEVKGLFDETARACGTLDIVLANAADILVKPLTDCTEEDYDRIFDTNTKRVFFTLQEAARRVNAGGRIIVSSTGGTKMYFPGQSPLLGQQGSC